MKHGLGQFRNKKTSGITKNVFEFHLVADFHMYFAVRTKMAVNDSNSIYTVRAKATWQFDGSGTVGNPPLPPEVWSLTGKGNTGDLTFSEVHNGDRVPVTTGKYINDLAIDAGNQPNHGWTVAIP